MAATKRKYVYMVTRPKSIIFGIIDIKSDIIYSTSCPHVFLSYVEHKKYIFQYTLKKK